MHNYIVIEVLPIEEHEVDGIIIPATDDTWKVLGKIYSVGPMCRIPVSKGDTVFFTPYGTGERVMVDGTEYLICLDWELQGGIDD